MGQTVLKRKSDTTTANPAPVGSFQADAFQGHTFGDPDEPGSHLANYRNRVGSDIISGAGITMANVNWANGPARMVIKPDLTNGVPRISSETRSAAGRVSPVILI